MPELRKLASRFLPKEFVTWLSDFRAIELRYRVLFLRLELRRAFEREKARDWSKVQSITFVCHGNVLRSPMAAELLRRSLQGEGNHLVTSAGVFATDGGAADERAVIAAEDYGLSLASHRARRLSKAIVDVADVIVIMDRRNETTIIGRFPAARDKLVLLGSFLPRATRESLFIADPYAGTIADVRRCYQTLAMAVGELAKQLRGTTSVRTQA